MGLISWGVGCQNPWPSAHVDVSKFVRWIYNSLNEYAPNSKIVNDLQSENLISTSSTISIPRQPSQPTIVAATQTPFFRPTQPSQLPLVATTPSPRSSSSEPPFSLPTGRPQPSLAAAFRPTSPNQPSQPPSVLSSVSIRPSPPTQLPPGVLLPTQPSQPSLTAPFLLCNDTDVSVQLRFCSNPTAEFGDWACCPLDALITGKFQETHTKFHIKK